MRGRIRTVKPELLSDELLWDLESQSGMPLLRVFIGMVLFADREGRFEWSPRALRGAVAPCWDGDMSAALELLAKHRYLVRYRVDGKDYGYVRNFLKHQSVNKHEAASILPPPTECTGMHMHARAPVTETTLGKGREGNDEGREGKGSGKSVRTETRALVSRTVTMPSEEPTQEYLDSCAMAGVHPEQARSTWTHYWTAGLPERGVEKLVPWLVKSAKERANQTTRAGPRGGRSRNSDALDYAFELATALANQENRQ